MPNPPEHAGGILSKDRASILAQDMVILLIKVKVIRRPRPAGRAPGKPSVPFLGTFRESGELLCKKRVLALPQHSSKVRT